MNLLISPSVFILLFASYYLHAQTELVCNLDSDMKETSGLILLNGEVYTHNDSGDSPKLYKIDQQTGEVMETYVINAKNVDWEDICIDDTHIYIGDFGNNLGNRKDLVIYKISQADVFNQTKPIPSEKIIISYADQNDFSSRNRNHNYDGEGLIAYGDSLILFSKNWVNRKCYLYSIPKQAGTYALSKRDSFEAQGLVTGAVYDSISDVVHLSAYGDDGPYLIHLNQFSSNDNPIPDFSNIPINMPAGISFQMEGITLKNDSTLYLSVERSFSGKAALFTYLLPQKTVNHTSQIVNPKVFPNPVDSILNIECTSFDFLEIYHSDGSLVTTSKDDVLNCQSIPAGHYILKIYTLDGKVYSKNVMIQH